MLVARWKDARLAYAVDRVVDLPVRRTTTSCWRTRYVLELDTIFGFVSEIRKVRMGEEALRAETSHAGPCKTIFG